MKINDFKLECYFGKYEFTAPYLLTQSDCESMSTRDLLALEPGAQEKLPAFLQAVYQPLPEAVEKRYTFAAWLDNFLQPGAAD